LKPCALVIGGSLGGLFAAHLLRAIGWRVAVYERAGTDLAARGAGLGTREELFSVMRRVHLAAYEWGAVKVRSRVCLDWDGSVVHDVAVGSVATAWDAVYKALKRALPESDYFPSKELERFEDHGDSVTAFFADGSRASGQLLVGADGRDSRVRAQILPEIRPRYAGYVAWRGAVCEQDLPSSVGTLVFECMAFCFPEGELGLSVPMPGTEGARAAKRCQITWFQPVDEVALQALCTDDGGRHYGHAIPPPRIRAEVIRSLKARAPSVLAPQHAAMVAGLRQPILQPIFDLEVPRLVFGRALLLGDAAFVARPHVGTGVTKAALDAQCLADELRMAPGDVPAALKRYERERLPYGREIVARGRYLGAYLEAQGKPRGARVGRELHRQPARVMREFGAAGESGAGNAGR
jgi:2-polyprenyl-6-methoxyphenol hydroxylase-like FAD-dependent oxidoreductase